MNTLDWMVLSPLLALTAGSLVCLMLGAFSPKNRLSSGVALVSIAAALFFQSRLWNQEGSAFSSFYLVNTVTTLLGLLFLVFALLSWGFLDSYLEQNAGSSEFFSLFLIAPIGMFLMAGSQNLLLFFLGIEILSLPLYLLCAFQKENTASIESGLKYFLLGAFAAGFLLFGVALIYAASGTLSLPEIRAGLAKFSGSELGLFQAGIALLLCGILFKASLFPFHFWTPDVYEGAPTPITALMAAGTKAAAFASLSQIADLLSKEAATVLIAIAILTLFLGNLGALAQTNLKRMLAYSGIAHAGIALIAILSWPAGASAREALIFYLAAYGLTAIGSFGLISYLEKAESQTALTLESIRGLAKRRPVAAAAMLFLLLSLGGIPPTAGFLAKYFVFAAAIEAQMTGLAIVGILFSVVALGYYLRVVVNMYMMSELQSSSDREFENPWSAWLAASAATIAVFLFGVQPQLLLRLF